MAASPSPIQVPSNGYLPLVSGQMHLCDEEGDNEVGQGDVRKSAGFSFD
jgi:hypothetical protein